MTSEQPTRFDFSYEELCDLHAMVMDSRQMNWDGHESRCPVTCTMCVDIRNEHDSWIERLETAMKPYEDAMERQAPQ